MGAWGTGIFEDDTACDVRDQFIDYLEEGKTIQEATAKITEEYEEEFSIEDDLEVMSIVYISLAAVQLEKNELQEEVRKTAIELIDRGADLELWEEADGEDYEERQKVLEDFNERLLSLKR
ncbi:DUF4259 domain-containing protein [Bacillus marinisedimentorum]|uniref:DUF4259 domain-containing protein n=1 Tax=Bacillus marinisedimentorum TaxID=1821260 RepID=UPI0007E07AAF|nr:DUF4259 domain-containing protein [Bacillus marinisedimentorum]